MLDGRLGVRLSKVILISSLLTILLFSQTGCQAINQTGLNTFYYKVLDFFGFSSYDTNSAEGTALSFLDAVNKGKEKKAVKYFAKKSMEKFDYKVFVKDLEKNGIDQLDLKEMQTLEERKLNGYTYLHFVYAEIHVFQFVMENDDGKWKIVNAFYEPPLTEED